VDGLSNDHHFRPNPVAGPPPRPAPERTPHAITTIRSKPPAKTAEHYPCAVTDHRKTPTSHNKLSLVLSLEFGSICPFDTEFCTVLRSATNWRYNVWLTVGTYALFFSSPSNCSCQDDDADKTQQRASIANPLELKVASHGDWVYGVATSPDSRIFATGSCDDVVKLWDLKSGEHVRTLRGPRSCISSIAFSPDGSLVAAGSQDYRVSVWETKSGKAPG
jgi:WD40 repeat protein